MDPDGTPTGIDARLLGGLALIDRGEFYEAHEVLEDLWAGEVGAARHVLQALIQIAVALHHRNNGNLGGARTLLLRAREHCTEAGSVLGIEGRELDRGCARLLDEVERTAGRGAVDVKYVAPPIDSALVPRFDALRATIREQRQRHGLDPDPPIELPPS